jgi:hypothetical protein
MSRSLVSCEILRSRWRGTRTQIFSGVGGKKPLIQDKENLLYENGHCHYALGLIRPKLNFECEKVNISFFRKERRACSVLTLMLLLGKVA